GAGFPHLQEGIARISGAEAQAQGALGASMTELRGRMRDAVRVVELVEGIARNCPRGFQVAEASLFRCRTLEWLREVGLARLAGVLQDKGLVLEDLLGEDLSAMPQGALEELHSAGGVEALLEAARALPDPLPLRD
ncbi:unnamed protein product, partial [Discosporangium mesarthrocarpum]